ncbi:MAG: hypothetical protein DYH17_10975 [Xanthomonadales bacterium PRO6]|nr:hypothetical protein [Xanthomonadales bacterium PRO6]
MPCRRPNQLRVSDFTCAFTWPGWLHIAFTDVHARRIVGWRPASGSSGCHPRAYTHSGGGSPRWNSGPCTASHSRLRCRTSSRRLRCPLLRTRSFRRVKSHPSRAPTTRRSRVATIRSPMPSLDG